jgi:hypothetical protein
VNVPAVDIRGLASPFLLSTHVYSKFGFANPIYLSYDFPLQVIGALLTTCTVVQVVPAYFAVSVGVKVAVIVTEPAFN